jgi:hypothetical protein
MKYWKLLILIMVALLIAGCSSINYDISLDKVNLINPEKIDLTDIVKDDMNKYTFNDERIKIKWGFSPSQFSFNLLNQTTDSIEIVWDKSAYIDIDGKNHRLIHSGVKYIERNNSQPNTIIIPNTSIDDIIYPSDYIYYNEGEYGGWRESPLFNTYVEQKSALDEAINTYVGKNVQTLLSLKIGDNIYNYVFTFKINDCHLVKQ